MPESTYKANWDAIFAVLNAHKAQLHAAGIESWEGINSYCIIFKLNGDAKASTYSFFSINYHWSETGYVLDFSPSLHDLQTRVALRTEWNDKRNYPLTEHNTTMLENLHIYEGAYASEFEWTIKAMDTALTVAKEAFKTLNTPA